MTSQLPGGPRGLRGFSGDVSAKLHAARLWITAHRPYYSRALLACPLIPTAGQPTMAIAMDHQWRIFVNPDYVSSSSVEHTAAVLIHELNHALRSHAERGEQTATPEHIGYWRIACDLEINDDLEDDDLDIDGLLLPEAFGLEPYNSAESYYHQLLDNAASLDEVPDCGPVCTPHATGHDRLDPAGEAGLSELQRQAIRQATAKLIIKHNEDRYYAYYADIPPGLRDWAQQTACPQADWRQLLATVLRQSLQHQSGAGDFTWQRPPRRSDPDDPVLRPALTAATGRIAVVLDTSGSMRSDDHAQAYAEIDAILTKAVPGTAVTVLSVDHDIQHIQRVNQARNITPLGGCGTDMAAGIETAAQANPAAIVVITDGYTPWPASPPPGASCVIAALTHNGWLDRVPGWIRTIDITPAAHRRGGQ